MDPVLGQQAAALLLRQEVPLGRAHERVHARERLRRRALHERRRVIGRELRRLHDAHERPRHVEEAAGHGPAERHDELLHLLR
jgi:hypothetical protein